MIPTQVKNEECMQTPFFHVLIANRTPEWELFVELHSLCQCGLLPVHFTAHGAMEHCKIKIPRKDHRKGMEAIARMKGGTEDEPS